MGSGSRRRDIFDGTTTPALDPRPPVSIPPAVFTPAHDPWLRRAEGVVDATLEGARWLYDDEGRLAALLSLALALALLLPVSRPELPSVIVHLPGTGWVDAATVEGVPSDARDGDRLVLVTGRAVRAAAPPPAVDGAGVPERAFNRAISLNNASPVELETLPGVGPALAARIVAGRPYDSVDALDRVKGIGPKTLSRLRGRVEP